MKPTDVLSEAADYIMRLNYKGRRELTLRPEGIEITLGIHHHIISYLQIEHAKVNPIIWRIDEMVKQERKD